MKCPKCQTENPNTARFCAGCGSPLQAPRAAAPRSSTGLRCAKCGTNNPPGSVFCESCGNRLAPPATPRTSARPQPAAAPAASATASRTAVAATEEKQPTSGAWWLLPIVLAWIGGLIGFVVIREKDKKKANGLLVLGIVMTFAWPVIWFALAALLSFPAFTNFSY